MNAIEKYTAQVDVYNAQIQAYQVQADLLAKQMQTTLEQQAYNILKKGFPAMASKKVVFTVFEAANGYFAETSLGQLVIGTTLSEVCTAAQGKAAEEKLMEDSVASPRDPLGQVGKSALWEKVRPLFHDKAVLEEMLKAAQPMTTFDKFINHFK